MDVSSCIEGPEIACPLNLSVTVTSCSHGATTALYCPLCFVVILGGQRSGRGGGGHQGPWPSW